jgi:LPS-assembly lipoprotein
MSEIHRSYFIVRVAGLAIAIVLCVPGCGFQLRGKVELPPAMSTTYLEGPGLDGVIGQNLRDALQSSGVDVTSERGKASAVFRSLDYRAGRSVLSVNSSGKVQQYQLYTALVFEVRDDKGKVVVPSQKVSLVRNVLFDENDVLGMVNEQARLRKEMNADLVRLTMLRLEASQR